MGYEQQFYERDDRDDPEVVSLNGEIANLNLRISQLESGLRKIIQMNRNEALDRDGNQELAESWSCVIVARAALGRTQAK